VATLTKFTVKIKLKIHLIPGALSQMDQVQKVIPKEKQMVHKIQAIYQKILKTLLKVVLQ